MVREYIARRGYEGVSGMDDAKVWLNRKEAAAYLRTLNVFISPKTLANLAANNNARQGPSYYRMRWNTVRYEQGELKAWAATQTERVE